MTPQQAAQTRRVGSGATNPPSYGRLPAVVADARAPLPVYAEPSPTSPDAILANRPTQLKVFQFLDDRAVRGGGNLPTLEVLCRLLRMKDHQISAALVALAKNAMLVIERDGGKRIVAIQIVPSGRWLRRDK